MKISPYLTFDGNCQAAFEFYAQCLRGTIEKLLRFGETPACEHVPADYQDKIMHVRLEVGDQVLMGSDCHPAQPYEGIRGSSVTLNLDSISEAERIFSALAEQGTQQMPMQETFWAVRFGMLVDRFGVPWIINCEKDQ